MAAGLNRATGAAALIVGVGLWLAGMSAASAGVTTLKTVLNGATEVPPVETTARGDATITLDTTTKTLSWIINYLNLSGPATAAHFHGPADPGGNAGVEVPIPVSPTPIQGSATLTDAQIADLAAGKVYINIHTQAHPGGEIRGWIGH